MTRFIRAFLWLALLWSGLSAVGLATRPLLPVDETRYLGASWEMWIRDSFLVPTVNFEPYTRKPPLLFWLIQAGWSLFGVSELWGRIISPLFGLISLGLTACFTRLLWPTLPEATRLAPVVLLGSALFLAYGTLTMFDTMLIAWILAGLIGVLDAWRNGGLRGWLVLGVAIGLGILTKGPVMLLHVLPVTILAPLWAAGPHRPDWGRWYGGVALAVAIGAAIALAWAIPAALTGGEAYANEILFRQTAGRLTGIKVQGQIWKTHSEPFWWYVPLLPIALAPWIFWPPAWRALVGLRRKLDDPGVRLCLLWVIATFVLFSMIRGKQIHYLLPMVVAMAMLLARGLVAAYLVAARRDLAMPALVLIGFGAVMAGFPLLYDWAAETFPSLGLPGFLAEVARRFTPWGGLAMVGVAVLLLALGAGSLRRQVWVLALGGAAAFVAIHIEGTQSIWPRFDLSGLAVHVAEMQRQEKRFVFADRYDGELHFLGRLTRPIDAVRAEAYGEWVRGHPDSSLVQFVYGDSPGPPDMFSYAQPYLGGWAVVFRPPAESGAE